MQSQETASLKFLDSSFVDSKYTSLLIKNDQEKTLAQKQAEKFFIPASTTKLVTAFFALNHWGENHRFKTEFYLEGSLKSPILVVKGYGDPFLVSEEIKLIAEKVGLLLSEKGIIKIATIKLDTSYYSNDLKMVGSAESDDPYSAIPSALTANFNTIFIQKNNGIIQSAERQTPLTPTAKSFGVGLKGKKLRVNTGNNVRTGERNFAELLRIFLQKQGLEVAKKVVWEAVNPRTNLLYSHYNSKNLAEIIRPMMKYSTNFIANQLALNLSAEIKGVPASAETLSFVFQQKMIKLLGWQGAILEEGAGLSKMNRLSAKQLVDLLKLFKPWKFLLPEIEKNIFAKSGTLIGVTTLAGYIKKGDEWYPFALMINQKTPYHYRNKIAIQLKEFVLSL